MKFYLSVKPSAAAQAIADKVRQVVPTARNPLEAEAVMAIGGDGSIIHAIRSFHQFSRPFVGLHAGSEGALCRLQLKNLEEQLAGLDQSGLARVHLINVHVGENNALAVQDARLERQTIRPLHSRIELGGTVLANCHAGDGLIVANSIGSTGYNRSAGGQVLNANDPNLVLTPVCPTYSQVAFDNLMESVVIGDQEVVFVPREDVLFVADNREQSITAGTRVVICRSYTTYQFWPKEEGI
jgi:NAD+ kinase